MNNPPDDLPNYRADKWGYWRIASPVQDAEPRNYVAERDCEVGGRTGSAHLPTGANFAGGVKWARHEAAPHGSGQSLPASNSNFASDVAEQQTQTTGLLETAGPVREAGREATVNRKPYIRGLQTLAKVAGAEPAVTGKSTHGGRW